MQILCIRDVFRAGSIVIVDDTRHDEARISPMKLPARCPFEERPREQPLGPESQHFDCCRLDSYRFGDEPPLCRFRETESEVYRFLWRSSFDGAAFVQIARAGDSVGLRSRVLGRSRLYRKEPVASATLSPGDWEKLQRALTISDFWSLDGTNEEIGLTVRDG
jgi:hypothetical protein